MDAVVLAAGSSTRMGGSDKTLSPLGGEPLIIWSLRAFESSPEVRAVVVTASEANREGVTEAIRKARLRKVTKVVLGGPSRSESVFNGLEALANKGAAFVAIHDGARPFVTAEIICRGVRTARKHGAAVAAVRTVDTVKLVDHHGQVERTPPRDRVWLAQTPQIGRLGELLEAHYRNHDRLGEFTDDVALLEHEGVSVHVFESDVNNVKITHPEDLQSAQSRLAQSTSISTQTITIDGTDMLGE